MYAHSYNYLLHCIVWHISLSLKSISPRSEIPVETRQVVWRQRGTGWSSYFYLKPRSELRTQKVKQEESGIWATFGNVNQVTLIIWTAVTLTVHEAQSLDIACPIQILTVCVCVCVQREEGNGMFFCKSGSVREHTVVSIASLYLRTLCLCWVDIQCYDLLL